MCSAISQVRTADEEEAEGSEEGEKRTEPGEACDYCGGKSGDLKRCSRCKAVWYCSRNCQKDAWKTHKTRCVKQ